MREIRVTLKSPLPPAGNAVVIPVKVNWPELQLTEDQIVQNAIARAWGMEIPHPDNSFIAVTIECPFLREERFWLE